MRLFVASITVFFRKEQKIGRNMGNSLYIVVENVEEGAADFENGWLRKK